MSLPRLTRTTPRPGTGIVHFGPGAFFRSFVAVQTAEAMAVSGGDWGICAVSLRSAAIRDALEPQGGAYQVVSMTQEGEQPRRIEAITDVLVAPEDPGAVLRTMADPGVHVVTLTITEKGYHLSPATGALQLDDPEIAHDIANPQAPRTAPGFIVAALAARRATGTAPFAVLSCDNLPGNGALARGVVLALARERDAELADWIAAHVRFPATMVDRITPATTDADIERLARATGVEDRACVFAEPFRQWVIEDDFDAPRPDWAAAGAQIVGDVAPFEAMKLRCLNGTHSALAYLGYLAGHETISDAVADPPFEALCRHLWAREILPTLETPEGEDLPAYCEALLARYRNTAIRHRTWQIAMDGSQKLPQRLLAPMADQRAAGRGIDGLALSVAGWMRYVGGRDEAGRPIDVRDPLAERLRALSRDAGGPEARVRALLSVETVFPRALAADATVIAALTEALDGLERFGARQAVGRLVA